MRYGMPFRGSKNTIAEKIIKVLPEADCFVDLFGGGGAITHCALLSGKYQKVIYNELDKLVFDGFVKAVNGGFKDERRWISHEDFHRLKDTDFYVACCFSFGNNFRNYCYSPDVEVRKKAVHEMLFAPTVRERRLKFRKVVKLLNDCKNSNSKSLQILQSLQSLESLERLERLERLESLQNLERLELLNLSYEQVEIPQNAVVYCDIPYKGTEKYKQNFDYEKFYDWARKSKNKVYISEYQMPNDFDCIAEFERTGRFSPTNNSHRVIERLFTNGS